MIRLDGVTKRFGGVAAVDGASLCVERGEVVALLGPSGCGKTTLLRLIAGFERPDAGTVEVASRRVSGQGVCVSPEQRGIGMVFQDYALFPHLSVARNVGFGLPRNVRPSRVPNLPRWSGSTVSAPGTRISCREDSSSVSRLRAPSLQRLS